MSFLSEYPIPANPDMNGGLKFQDLHDIVHKYKILSSAEAGALLMDLSVLIGHKDKNLQKIAEHYSMVYGEHIRQEV